jgi:hypothetical protein
MGGVEAATAIAHMLSVGVRRCGRDGSAREAALPGSCTDRARARRELVRAGRCWWVGARAKGSGRMYSSTAARVRDWKASASAPAGLRPKIWAQVSRGDIVSSGKGAAVVLKSELSGLCLCLCLSCGDGRMTLEAASEALDRQVTVAGRRARRGRRRVFLPSSSHGNLLLLLPCPVLMCNRGVRHGQPLTRATGPLSPMGTGSNAVGQVTGWACWAVHLPRRILAILARGTSRSVPPQPHPLLCRSLARAASTDIKPWQPANAFTCELAGEPQHCISFVAQTLRPRLRFILLGMEDGGMTCCSASRVPPLFEGPTEARHNLGSSLSNHTPSSG